MIHQIRHAIPDRAAGHPRGGDLALQEKAVAVAVAVVLARHRRAGEVDALGRDGPAGDDGRGGAASDGAHEVPHEAGGVAVGADEAAAAVDAEGGGGGDEGGGGCEEGGEEEEAHCGVSEWVGWGGWGFRCLGGCVGLVVANGRTTENSAPFF